MNEQSRRCVFAAMPVGITTTPPRTLAPSTVSRPCARSPAPLPAPIMKTRSGNGNGGGEVSCSLGVNQKMVVIHCGCPPDQRAGINRSHSGSEEGAELGTDRFGECHVIRNAPHGSVCPLLRAYRSASGRLLMVAGGLNPRHYCGARVCQL